LVEMVHCTYAHEEDGNDMMKKENASVQFEYRQHKTRMQ